VTKFSDQLVAVDQAWTVKRGETVLLRVKRRLTPEQMAFHRDQMETVAKSLGIHLVLLDADVEVVNPHSGESA